MDGERGVRKKNLHERMVSRKEALTRTWNSSRKIKDQILLNEPGQICAIMDIWNAIAEL